MELALLTSGDDSWGGVDSPQQKAASPPRKPMSSYFGSGMNSGRPIRLLTHVDPHSPVSEPDL